jgi:RNA-directed DNA polymerase
LEGIVSSKSKKVMNTATPMYKWQEIPWRKLERKVFKLQKRIFQAASRGDNKKVRKLQRLLLNSWAAKCLAVRKVTQDNRGKRTAGVDGIKALSPEARLALVGRLKLDGKTKPTRRIWIPKPGKAEKRPLGIPTIKERAKQALAKIALEPEWEAKFEASSYGFRPGRSAHDAVEHIHTAIKRVNKYILDADIKKCFDQINHERLLEKLNTSPIIRRQIRAWLKSGVMDGKELFPTKEGTPQGGVCSPLLANIALHGMIDDLKEWAANPPKHLEREFPNSRRDRKRSLTIVRYADDFVLIHKSRKVIEEARKFVEKWLERMGLELNQEKTRIVHTLEREDGEKPGIYRVSKYKSGKKQKGYVTHCKPSKEEILRHYRVISEKIDQLKNAPQIKVIKELNPLITGWTNYFRIGVSSEIFKKLNHLVFKKLWAWAKRRHPNKNAGWIKNKY